MTFDSLTNRNEYFSAHYLDSLLQAGLKDQRDRWAELEGKGEPTARSRLRGLGQQFFAARADVGEDADALREMHGAVLGALGFTVDRQERPFLRGGAALEVPVAASCDTSTGLLLVAVEAGFATDVDAALGRDGAGELLDPPIEGTTASGKPKPAMTAAVDLVGHLFACDDPPRYVMLLAGGIVVLADRAKWGEGKYLAVNLDDALGRNDTKAKGELETIAGLFSADVLVPEDGQSTLDTLVDASRKHAVGVSEDLRDGIRASIELLANEVIEQRLAAHRGVYGGAVDPRQLTTESLRYLYRIVFLLFAESRPELGILPVDAPEYAEGYGLDRLRELALTDLHSDRARNGTHIQQSLSLLFELVNDGYRHKGAQTALALDGGGDAADGTGHIGLVFEPLRSDLFSEKATPLLDGVKLRNQVLQQVLALLMLSKERKGRGREFVSYANLGINQLGAVYEGLMAYSGFFAETDLYEVARHGDAKKGSWVVPVDDADDYPDEVFVTHTDDDGGSSRVRHAKGSFVLRLSGRDRQRSASYYTPKVLTECVVRHALAELLDQDDTTTPAADILELTICEPALGSGAFLNEAIDQLAAEYLARRQDELGESLDPERYTAEMQRVKAHLALHQCYGVDLNRTAVELAEVSLWLNAMHPGLQAPWFGMHLRRGNSLVGARRATYEPEKLKKGAWLKAVPTDRHLAEGPIGDKEIHHFLLPADGWGAVAQAKEAKELRPDEVQALKAWKKTHKTLTDRQVQRLQALARRVESLWDLALARLKVAEHDLRRPIEVWGAPTPTRHGGASREQIEAALRDPNSALGRLRLVMDAWCALWFWPVDGPDGMPAPPSVASWLDTLEAVLGIDPGDLPTGQLDLFADLLSLLDQEEALFDNYGMQPVAVVEAAQPWLTTMREISEREGFFHWELEFATVFERGGFDLQVGNPPWVRLDWQDDITLAEFDPWFGVTEMPKSAAFRSRRAAALDDLRHATRYCGEAASSAGLVEILGAPTLRPLLAGIRTNLYMVFMDQVWRCARSGGGISGLLHPESHFADPKGGRLRAETYGRLRRHWQFVNTYRLFEISAGDNNITFGAHIYGAPSTPTWTQLCYVRVPEMVDQSLVHDGGGPTPTLQRPAGGWDDRPHKRRVLTIERDVLASWARLFDEPGTPVLEARLLRPVTIEDLEALQVLADQPDRLADCDYHWTPGWNETNAKEDGIIERETRVPDSLGDVVLQGPHFTIATLFAKQPNENCSTNRDYATWDLESLPESVVPRTNYQRICSRDEYDAAVDHWNGRPSTAYWRHIHREMTQSGLERSVQGCLLPPGPAHIHACLTYVFDDHRDLVRFAAEMASIPIDYLFKASGAGHVAEHQLKRIPLPKKHVLDGALALRSGIL